VVALALSFVLARVYAGGMEPGVRDVGVRAAVHALDAALAEHRRAVALASGARERERMAGARAVKAVAAASAAALEQRVERPMRALRVAETWIEVDRVRHPLTDAVEAELDGAELFVRGEGWSARLVLPPGEGPATAARAAVARVGEAARGAASATTARLRLIAEAALADAAARHAAASALAAADRRIAERHADRTRADACLAELEERLGARRLDEPDEVAAARARVAPARLYLDATPEQPLAWIGDWPSAVAGAMLRDLPGDRRAAAEPAMRRLLGALHDGEPLLALAATADGVAAATPERLLLASADAVHEPRLAAPAGLAEARPGRLAAVVELVRAKAEFRNRV
jgi:hypothetical protein